MGEKEGDRERTEEREEEDGGCPYNRGVDQSCEHS